MWPFGIGQIQTLLQAGGIMRDLIRASASGSRNVVPSEVIYVKVLPTFFRRIPGILSLTYRRPADLAAFTGSRSAIGWVDGAVEKCLTTAYVLRRSSPRYISPAHPGSLTHCCCGAMGAPTEPLPLAALP